MGVIAAMIDARRRETAMLAPPEVAVPPSAFPRRPGTPHSSRRLWWLHSCANCGGDCYRDFIDKQWVCLACGSAHG